MPLSAEIRDRVSHSGRVFKAGLPRLWATIIVILALVGGSVAAAATWGVKHWPAGIIVLLAILLGVTIEGSYRDANALRSAHATELDDLRSAHRTELDNLQSQLDARLAEAARQRLLDPPDEAPRELRSPDRLSVGESLYSPHGHYRIGLEEDGNLIMFQREVEADQQAVVEQPKWTSATARAEGKFWLTLTDSGRVVLYDSHADGDVEICGTNTANRGAKVLRMQDDGNLVLYSNRGAEWSAWAGDLYADIRKEPQHLNFYLVQRP